MSASTWLASPPDDHLEHGGLVLRAWRFGDGPGLLAAVLESIEELHPWMPWARRDYGPLDAEAFIEHAIRARRDGSGFLYAIIEHDDLAGAIGLHRRDDPPRLEIGYWVHTAHAGRGLATRSVRLLAGAALRLPEVTCLEIRHDRANTRSGNVPRRVGFAMIRDQARQPTAPGETGREYVWRLTDAADITVGSSPPPRAT